MKNVSLADARANIAEVLDAVARGETVTISPDGEASATDPAKMEDERRVRTNRAIEGILELRKHTKPVSVDEIIAWKNEGRE